MMKPKMSFSLIVVFAAVLSVVAFAQTDKPADMPQHDQHAQPAAPETKPAEGLPVHDAAVATLEKLAQTLAQENVTPETVKSVAAELKQLAEQMKQMPMPPMPEMSGMMECPKMKEMKPGMMECPKMKEMKSGMTECPKMKEMASGMTECPKMKEMKSGMTECPKMKGMKPKMMADKPMMEMDPMMPMMKEMSGMLGPKPEPQAMSQMMQMRGEMLKAMGDIMLKYGKTMPAEPKPAAEAAQPALSIAQTAKTATYEVALKIGPAEKMLTAEEAKTAKAGEVMTGGEMAMDMPGMPLAHHVEVTVKDLKSGAAVADQPVTLQVTDAAKQAANIPVATMYGVEKGVADTHFGNNATLPAGDDTIAVTVGAETATFQVMIPAP